MKYYQIKLFSCISLLLVIATSGYASGWQKAVKCADAKAQKKYYAMAADKYERILRCKKFPADSVYSVKVKLANCYMKMENTFLAEANFGDVVHAGKADALTTFCYARSLEANDKYADAVEWFDKVADDPSLKGKHVKGFVKVCENAMKSGKSDKFRITREGFNTSASEYAPAYYKKGIVYTSNRNERFKAAERTMWNKERFTDLYIVQEDNKGDLRMTDKLPAPVNSRLNDGAAVFNSACDEVYFTRNDKHRKRHDLLQILWSKFDGTNWSRPQVLSFEMPGANYAHPALSPDGNTLYFSSDLASSTLGGMDIFMVHRNGNTWDAPVNLGDQINTSGNETFPFVAGDGSLYFTSDGWPGYGGMDIFHAKVKDGVFTKAENMGVDFNSCKDDLSLIIDSRNRTGYFASNRAGDDDIYSFRLPAPKSDDKDKEKQKQGFTGTVTDNASRTPVAGALVEIYRDNEKTGNFCYTDDQGVFTYPGKVEKGDKIKVIKAGYSPYTLDANGLHGEETIGVILDADASAATIAAPAARQNLTVVYFELNKTDLSNADMDKLQAVIAAAKNTDKHVYISGYADEQGNDKYNFALSQRRVKVVLEFLTNQGVDLGHITSEYFGAVKLTNQCRSNPKCAADMDRENRRVEIFIAN